MVLFGDNCSVHFWENSEMWWMHIIEYYAAKKKNEGKTHKDLQGILVNGKMQTEQCI